MSFLPFSGTYKCTEVRLDFYLNLHKKYMNLVQEFYSFSFQLHSIWEVDRIFLMLLTNVLQLVIFLLMSNLNVNMSLVLGRILSIYLLSLKV